MPDQTPHKPAVNTSDIDWLLHEEKMFACFFRPRCGSTTLTRWFFENIGYKFGGFSIAAFRNEWLQPRIEQLTAFLDAHYDELHKFVVVRDPFDRAVSSYLHAVNNLRNYQWDVIKKKISPEIQKEELTFRQFVDFLSLDDLDATSLIWRRQSVLSCWKRGVDDIVCLEQLNEYLEQMNHRFGFAVPPSWNSVTVYEDEKIHGYTARFCDSPFRELLAFKEQGKFRSFPHYERFYDADLVEQVSELYRDDIDIYVGARREESSDNTLTKLSARISLCDGGKGRQQHVIARSQDVVFENEHYVAALDGRQLRIYSMAGRLLIDDVAFSYGICESFNPRAQMDQGGARVLLDRVDGLHPGDSILVCKDIYGGAAQPHRTYATHIAEVWPEERAIALRPRVPAGWFSSDLAIFLLKRSEIVTRHIEAAAWTEPIDGGMRVVLERKYPTLDLKIAVDLQHGSGRIRFTPRVRYKYGVDIYEQTIVLRSGVPVSEIYLKNRQLERARPFVTADRYWLWKEGARFGDGSASWLSIHNPRVAMIELHNARPIERKRLPVHVEESSPFSDKAENGVLAAFRGSGGYALSAPLADGPAWFTVALDHEVVLGGIEVEWYDEKTFASHFELHVRVGGLWREVAILRDHRPNGRVTEISIADHVPVQAIKLVAHECQRLNKLAIRNVWFYGATGQAPELHFSLEHFSAQKYRRHREWVPGGHGVPRFMRFEELSAPRFKADDVADYEFNVFVGEGLPPAPRLMLSPGGFQATHIWTEHADSAHLRTHRAVYYGREDIDKPSDAIGGFVRYGHPVTKSIFFDNPMAHRNPPSETGEAEFGEMVSFERDENFRTFIDQLHEQGHEICLHTTAPQGVPAADEARAIEFMATRYGSRTWIDHNMHEVRSCISSDGLDPAAAAYTAETWRKHGIRYFWTWASEDYMHKHGRNIDLLHGRNGQVTATPVYWRHPTIMGEFLTWAATESLLEYYYKGTLDRLVSNWGVSIHHAYYPYVCRERESFLYYYRDLQGRLVATEKFNAVLQYMAQLRDRGELNLSTVGAMMDYWVALEQVHTELRADGRVVFHNRSQQPIQGFSFAIRAAAVEAADLEFHARRHADGDLIVWFDFPTASSVEFTVRDAGSAIATPGNIDVAEPHRTRAAS
jgi:hypothetical protein